MTVDDTGRAVAAPTRAGGDGAPGAPLLRLRTTERVPSVIYAVFAAEGWLVLDEGDEASGWELWWKSGRFRPSDYASVGQAQRLNHFPKLSSITRKDLLARSLRRMRAVHGAVFDFAPETWHLPADYTKFVAAYTAERERVEAELVAEGALPARGALSDQSASLLSERMPAWICKPADGSRGRKIFLIRDIGELDYDCPYVVQRYVDRPLLLGGRKFDLRLYVLVTSMRPLRAFLYRDGLVRLATAQYDASDRDNAYVHLTNTSINKHAPRARAAGGGAGDEAGASNAPDAPDARAPECKLALSSLLAAEPEHLACSAAVWERIRALISLTLLSAAPDVPPSTASCFELLGFDILIDACGKPWLIEVNCSPALGVDSAADETVKPSLLRDALRVLDLGAALSRARADGASSAAGGGGGRRSSQPRRRLEEATSASRQRATAPTAHTTLRVHAAAALSTGPRALRRVASERRVRAPSAERERSRSRARSFSASTTRGAPPAAQPAGGFELLFPTDARAEALAAELSGAEDGRSADLRPLVQLVRRRLQGGAAARARAPAHGAGPAQVASAARPPSGPSARAGATEAANRAEAAAAMTARRASASAGDHPPTQGDGVRLPPIKAAAPSGGAVSRGAAEARAPPQPRAPVRAERSMKQMRQDVALAETANARAQQSVTNPAPLPHRQLRHYQQ